MQIKTSELKSDALNWFVAMCNGYDASWLMRQLTNPNPKTRSIPEFSTDWAQGGPIIEKEGLHLEPWGSKPGYMAFSNDRYSSRDYSCNEGATPLVAAMRCFVTSKMGEIVEVPDELCSDTQSQENEATPAIREGKASQPSMRC